MKSGPKFKIAKRLGAPIFEKTQTAKFALSQARGGRKLKRPGQASDYKRQLIEKQIRRYVDEAIDKSTQPIPHLMERLESRLDNTVYRLGLAKTRRFARQIVSHGHIFVNGKRLDIPSHKVRVGDVVSVREGSKQTGLFVTLAETHESASVPAWLSIDIKKLEAKVTGVPVYNPAETLFDPEQVMEYYSR